MIALSILHGLLALSHFLVIVFLTSRAREKTEKIFHGFCVTHILAILFVVLGSLGWEAQQWLFWMLRIARILGIASYLILFVFLASCELGFPIRKDPANPISLRNKRFRLYLALLGVGFLAFGVLNFFDILDFWGGDTLNLPEIIASDIKWFFLLAPLVFLIRIFIPAKKPAPVLAPRPAALSPAARFKRQKREREERERILAEKRRDWIEWLRDNQGREAWQMVLSREEIPRDPFASVFGMVRVSSPGETWPRFKGIPMIPICQLNLDEVPIKPDILSDLSMITVFIKAEDELPDHASEGSKSWAVRAYPSLENLSEIETIPEIPQLDFQNIIPCGIQWKKIWDDYPCWHDALPLLMQFTGEKDHTREIMDVAHVFCDQYKNHGKSKVGGWPSSIQAPCSESYRLEAQLRGSETKPDPTGETGARYVFQLASEDEAEWTWGDAGFAYFERGSGTFADTWYFNWQCY